MTRLRSTIKSLCLCVLIYSQETEKKVAPFRPFNKLTYRETHLAIVSKELHQEWKEKRGYVCVCMCPGRNHMQEELLRGQAHERVSAKQE